MNRLDKDMIVTAVVKGEERYVAMLRDKKRYEPSGAGRRIPICR